MSKEQAQTRLQMQQERDALVQQFCVGNDIRLICIDGRKYTNSKLRKYMIDKIIPFINLNINR